MLAKNEGILAPKPLGRGIWRDFYALFPGDLEGFCLIVKTNPRGCPGGQPPGKPMISALCLLILSVIFPFFFLGFVLLPLAEACKVNAPEHEIQ